MNSQRALRVMHTIAGLKSSAGGTSNSVTVTCSELARAGLEIDLVSQDFGEPEDLNVLPDVAAVRTRFATANRLPFTNSVYSPGFRSLVAATCRESKPDLVHDHGLWLPANHAAASVCRDLRLPLIVSPHGMFGSNALGHERLKKALAWRVFQRRDLMSAVAACVNSGLEADDVRARGYDKPIAVIPHGVRLPSSRRHLARGTGAKIALYLGRIHPLKGLLALIQAWAAVRPDGWRLIMAGPDEKGYRRMVQEAIDREGRGGSIELVGAAFGESKARLYESASLFIQPSLSENFGMAIAEALAQGVPVITTKGTPWSAIVQEGCGWWVASTGPEIAAAIREASSLPDGELQAMGLRGRIFVEKNFTWGKVVTMLVALYGWVLGEGPRPDFVVGT